MNLSTWLAADRGRLTAMAQHFRLTQSAVSQWRTNGVPPARMKAVRDFTGGMVSLDDMLPESQLGLARQRGVFDPTWPSPEGGHVINVAAPAAEEVTHG